MIHNVVMNTQGVYPRGTIESYCRTCPRDEDHRKLMSSSSVNCLPKCWDIFRGSRYAMRGQKHYMKPNSGKHISVCCCWGLMVVTRGEKINWWHTSSLRPHDQIEETVVMKTHNHHGTLCSRRGLQVMIHTGSSHTLSAHFTLGCPNLWFFF